MNLWEERAARNEALFREVNERIAELDLATGGTAEFVCECSDANCTERIEVPLGTYERLRNDPYQFLVVPGHEQTELEHVVEHGKGFAVVRKDTPTTMRVAAKTDPRK
jgi:hypothetical protein